MDWIGQPNAEVLQVNSTARSTSCHADISRFDRNASECLLGTQHQEGQFTHNDDEQRSSRNNEGHCQTSFNKAVDAIPATRGSHGETVQNSCGYPSTLNCRDILHFFDEVMPRSGGVGFECKGRPLPFQVQANDSGVLDTIIKNRVAIDVVKRWMQQPDVKIEEDQVEALKLHCKRPTRMAIKPLHEYIHEVLQANYASQADAKNYFYQLPLPEALRPLFGAKIPCKKRGGWKTYRFKVFPMGWSSKRHREWL